jgi:DNA-binding CsgD family transcriptional regulator
VATDRLEEARAAGQRMHELQRLSPALWGLAEVALAAGDPGRAVELSEEARLASEAVADAAYLAPFLTTGTRACLGAGDPHAARRWFETASAAVGARGIPGTTPAIDHGRGLVELAEGSTGKARVSLLAAVDGWAQRGRAWEGTWALVDIARLHARTNQRTVAMRAAGAARDRGLELGAPAMGQAATDVLRAVGRGGEPEPWAPLTAREFEVARRIADGLTNVEIAEELGIARKTVASHVEHILAKLAVERRSGVAAWAASRPVLHSPASRR